MTDRFTGPDGARLLLEEIQENSAVRHNEALAQKLIADGAVRTYQAGELLIEQEAEDNDVCFVLMGRVEIVVNGVPVASRGPGDHLGEMAAIDPSARRSASVRALEKTTVLRVPEASISSIGQEFPGLWRNFAQELGNRLRQRGEYCVSPNETPRVFLGCAAEARDTAREIQAGLAHDRMEVVIWTDNVFGPSQTTIEALLREVQNSDFAVFLLTGDDETHSRATTTASPRDNVVFELGLFMGHLGQARTLFVRPMGVNLKVPTDLLGVTAVEYRLPPGNTNPAPALGPVCTAIRKRVNELGPKKR